MLIADVIFQSIASAAETTVLERLPAIRAWLVNILHLHGRLDGLRLGSLRY